jgi:hypothetical protein
MTAGILRSLAAVLLVLGVIGGLAALAVGADFAWLMLTVLGGPVAALLLMAGDLRDPL